MTKPNRKAQTNAKTDRRNVRELSTEEIARVAGGGLLSSPMGLAGRPGLPGVIPPGGITNP